MSSREPGCLSVKFPNRRSDLNQILCYTDRESPYPRAACRALYGTVVVGHSMDHEHTIELVLACLSLAIFLLYHIWHFCLPSLHAKGHIRICGRRYFNADQFSGTVAQLWAHAFGQDHKEAQTAVHTVSTCRGAAVLASVCLSCRLHHCSTADPNMLMQLRNMLMVCTLFATGTAYIGARAFPTVFLDDSYSYQLFRLNVRPSPPH